jgi:hypothetical protein
MSNLLYTKEKVLALPSGRSTFGRLPLGDERRRLPKQEGKKAESRARTSMS